MFDYSGAYNNPLRRRQFQDPGAPPDMGDAPPSLLNSGDGSGASPIVVGGDPSLQLSGVQPKRSGWQSFLGSMMTQPRQYQQGGMAGRLAGMAGQGGVAGGIGRVAKFFL